MMARDCLRSDSSAVARRRCELGPPLDPAEAVTRSREFGTASPARALQGARNQAPAHRCRDAGELDLVDEAVRLAHLLNGRSPVYGSPLASRRMATAMALQV